MWHGTVADFAAVFGRFVVHGMGDREREISILFWTASWSTEWATEKRILLTVHRPLRTATSGSRAQHQYRAQFVVVAHVRVAESGQGGAGFGDWWSAQPPVVRSGRSTLEGTRTKAECGGCLGTMRCGSNRECIFGFGAIESPPPHCSQFVLVTLAAFGGLGKSRSTLLVEQDVLVGRMRERCVYVAIGRIKSAASRGSSR